MDTRPNTIDNILSDYSEFLKYHYDTYLRTKGVKIICWVNGEFLAEQVFWFSERATIKEALSILYNEYSTTLQVMFKAVCMPNFEDEWRFSSDYEFFVDCCSLGQYVIKIYNNRTHFVPAVQRVLLNKGLGKERYVTFTVAASDLPNLFQNTHAKSNKEWDVFSEFEKSVSREISRVEQVCVEVIDVPRLLAVIPLELLYKVSIGINNDDTFRMYWRYMATHLYYHISDDSESVADLNRACDRYPAIKDILTRSYESFIKELKRRIDMEENSGNIAAVKCYMENKNLCLRELCHKLCTIGFPKLEEIGYSREQLDKIFSEIDYSDLEASLKFRVKDNFSNFFDGFRVWEGKRITEKVEGTVRYCRLTRVRCLLIFNCEATHEELQVLDSWQEFLD